MSKYQALWEYISVSGLDALTLAYDEIERIAGVPIDHSFLKYKKELLEMGWSVKKIHMKTKQVDFVKEQI